MALLTTQTPTPTGGLVPTYASANASDTFVPDDRTFLYVKNTNASTRTITISVSGTYHGLTATNPGPTIAATTGELVLGPFPADAYANPSTGVCTVTPSATAGVTYACIRLPVS